MIDDESYKKTMLLWADWCCSGVGMRGYPSASAFVHDYVDHVPGAQALVDDYPMMADIDNFVASTSNLDERIPMVLVSHWAASRDWIGTTKPQKLRRLRLSESKFYKLLDRGNYSVRGAISARYKL